MSVNKTYNAIDYQRSVLICMVIAIHVVNFGTLYPGIKNFINFFFMQAFLLITGYLVNIQKTLKEFVVYTAKIVVPYTIMVVAFAYGSTILPVRNGISEFTLPVVLKTIFVTSIGPYWFLHTMAVCGILYYVSFTLFRRLHTTGKLCVFASLLIIVSQYTPLLNITNASFYFAGAIIRVLGKQIQTIFKPSIWPILPFTLIACDVHSYKVEWGGGNFLAVLILSFSFLSIVPQMVLFIKNDKIRDVIGYVGRNTLPIYLFHPIFTMAAKYALKFFYFDSTGYLHLLFTICISIIGSLAIAYILDKWKLSYIFARKKFLR